MTHTPDRCEICGEDRGDGYCQNCPNDPDRVRDRERANRAVGAQLGAFMTHASTVERIRRESKHGHGASYR